MIEAATGRTVRQIFADDGEDAFRSLETAALLEALASPEPAVIAAAGGVVLREQNRVALKQAKARVVWLCATPELLVERVTSGAHRPLLDDDPEGTLQRMHDRARAVVPRGGRRHRAGRSPQPERGRRGGVAMITVRVPLGGRSYDVLVGHGARHELAGLLPPTARRAAIVTQEGVPLDVDPGVPAEVFTIGAGESHKTSPPSSNCLAGSPSSASPATTS